MKKDTAIKICKWTAGAALLACMAYSVLGLTIATQPAYASTCDCSEEEFEAFQYCQPFGGIATFECPVTSGGTTFWFATCNFTGATGETCPD
jgi:hypothetical protein